MTLSPPIFVGLIVVLVVTAAAFLGQVWIQRRRLQSLLPTLRCPTCGATYGVGVLSAMTRVKPTSKDVHLEDVIQVTCPHCSSKSQYRADGQLHEIRTPKR